VDRHSLDHRVMGHEAERQTAFQRTQRWYETLSVRHGNLPPRWEHTVGFIQEGGDSSPAVPCGPSPPRQRPLGAPKSRAEFWGIPRMRGKESEWTRFVAMVHRGAGATQDQWSDAFSGIARPDPKEGSESAGSSRAARSKSSAACSR
jgi:hypothetical protein